MIYQEKKRNKSAPRGSGMPIGSKLHWGINATETYKKVKGRYLVTIKGSKKQKGFTLDKKSKYIRPRKRFKRRF